MLISFLAFLLLQLVSKFTPVCYRMFEQLRLGHGNFFQRAERSIRCPGLTPKVNQLTLGDLARLERCANHCDRMLFWFWLCGSNWRLCSPRIVMSLWRKVRLGHFRFEIVITLTNAIFQRLEHPAQARNLILTNGFHLVAES